MAQLTDDIEAFSGALMPLAEARAAILRSLAPVQECQSVPVMAASGRILSADLVARLALPGFDNSAVDGYAVRHADLNPEDFTRLRVASRVIAGERAELSLKAGEAARIFTGAPMPENADTVFMQEDVKREGDEVILPAGLSRGANARRRGEDIAEGGTALTKGSRLTPQLLALAAALGYAQVPVRRQLRIGVLSTGNEVKEPGAPLDEAGLYDANRPMLAALVAATGASVHDGGIVRDEPAALSAALRRLAETCDAVISSGGVSTGEEDHVKNVVERQGRLTWWRVGIKPGRPVALGVIGTTSFIGLPGNPVAAYVTFTQIVRPLIAALAGENWSPPRPQWVRLGFSYKKREGRREFVRASLQDGADLPVAVKHPQDGAGVITSLTACEGLIELAEDTTAISAGEVAAFYPFSMLST